MASLSPGIIIGAGVAGLSAALAFEQAGVPYRILEAAERPGGRMLRQPHPDGGQWDVGAQFLAPPTPMLNALLARAGLGGELCAMPGDHAIIVDRSLHALDARAPAALLTARWLPRRELVLGGLSVLPQLIGSFHHGFHDYGRTARWDRPVSHRALSRLAAPVLDGVFFLDEADQSPAFTGALFAWLLRKGRFVTVRGGLGRLPERLGPLLGVEGGVAVRSVEMRGPAEVHVSTDDRTWCAPFCVLATPAPVARALLATPTDAERALLEVTYAPTLVVAWSLREKRPVELAGRFGVLFAGSAGGLIGSLSFPATGLFAVVTAAHHAAPELSSQIDEAVEQRLRRELARHFPALERGLGGAAVHRWAHAIPRSPVGRATAVQDYRRSLDPARPVRLAGDYTSFPNAESAAWTGWWSAHSLRAGGAT